MSSAVLRPELQPKPISRIGLKKSSPQRDHSNCSEPIQTDSIRTCRSYRWGPGAWEGLYEICKGLYRHTVERERERDVTYKFRNVDLEAVC